MVNSSRHSVLYSYTAVFVLIVSFFRVPLSFTFSSSNSLSIGVYLVIVGFIVAGILLRGRASIQWKSIGTFIFLVLFAALLYPKLTVVDSDSMLPVVVGLVSILAAPLVWSSILFNSGSNKTHIYQLITTSIIVLGVLNSLSAVYSYFVDPTLFGILDYSVYSNESILRKANVARRAASLVGGPQVLSVFSFVAFSVTIGKAILKKSFLLYGLSLLMIFAGILSGSKSFVLMMLILGIWYGFQNKNLVVLVGIPMVVGMVLTLTITQEEFSRLTYVFELLLNPSSSVTYGVWASFLVEPASWAQFLFGNGLGVLSSTAQNELSYSILGGSSESYLIQLYYECGILALISFLVLCYRSIRWPNKDIPPNLDQGMLLGLILNSVAVPALYGISFSVIFYFFLLFNLSTQNK